MPFKIVVFEASKLVSTKTLLLKHDYRRQGDFPLFFYAVFPFFLTHFFAFLRFSSLFSSSPKGQGRTTAIYCKNGEFHSDPVCTDPVQNFPMLAWPLCRNMSGILVVHKIFEDFAGDFPGGFFLALFSHKMKRKSRRLNLATESDGSKIKIRQKSVLPNTDTSRRP